MNINTGNRELDEQLTNFVLSLTERAGQNLKSVVLYGGVAKKDYTIGKSNVNILFVFESVDLDIMDSIALLFQQAMATFKLSPFILTISEVEPSSDVFAVKFFDIKQHSALLYGEDLLKNQDFNRAHLKFISEQELRNQLSRLKYFYIENFNLPENLASRIQKSFTTLVINANMFLYLKNSVYFATRREIINQLLQEAGLDKTVLNNLVDIRNGNVPLSPEIIRKAYDDLMLQYKQLIKLFRQID